MHTLIPEDLKIDKSNVPSFLYPLLSTGVSALTVLYPAMSIPLALLSCIYGEITQKSTQKQLELLENEFNDLKSKNLVSQDYLTSDNYIHLMSDILRNVYAFNSDKKRKSVAHIYKSVLQNKIPYTDSEEKLFIDAIEKINSQEILILYFMQKNEESLKTIGSWIKFYTLYSDQNRENTFDKYKFKLFAMQLENLGLAFCSDLSGYDAAAVFGPGTSVSSAGITPLGKNFLKYLGDQEE